MNGRLDNLSEGVRLAENHSGCDGAEMWTRRLTGGTSPIPHHSGPLPCN